MTIRRLVYLTIAIIAFLPSVALGAKREWADSALGDRVGQALVFEGRLWLAGRVDVSSEPYGGLASLDISKNVRVAHFREGVVALNQLGTTLAVLRELAPGEIVVSELRSGKFVNATSVLKMKAHELPLTLLSNAEENIVLTDEAVASWSKDARTWKRKPLKGKLRASYGVPSTVMVRDHLYVGFNNGEWGGGLQRVNLASGSVTNIERRDDTQLCTGPLNSSCDPVTGLVQDPQKSDCVLASVGLAHLSLRIGRIVRVCDVRVEVMLENSLDEDSKWKQTEPINGLVAAQGGGLWMLSRNRLYLLDSDMRTVGEYAPKLKRVLGVWLSRDVAGIVVLHTYLGSADYVQPMIVSVDH
jgi:hypothetical protein